MLPISSLDIRKYYLILLKILLCIYVVLLWTFLVAQTVRSLPAVQEAWVRSLGGEDLLEKEMATHSSILAWKIPWTEEPVGLQSMGSQRVEHDRDFTHMLY